MSDILEGREYGGKGGGDEYSSKEEGNIIGKFIIQWEANDEYSGKVTANIVGTEIGIIPWEWNSEYCER